MRKKTSNANDRPFPWTCPWLPANGCFRRPFACALRNSRPKTIHPLHTLHAHRTPPNHNDCWTGAGGKMWGNRCTRGQLGHWRKDLFFGHLPAELKRSEREYMADQGDGNHVALLRNSAKTALSTNGLQTADSSGKAKKTMANPKNHSVPGEKCGETRI